MPVHNQEVYNKRWLRSALGFLNPPQFKDQHIGRWAKSAA